MVHTCREKSRPAKAQLELTLAGAVSGGEGFFKCINSKRRSKESAVDQHLLKVVI